MSLRSMLRWRCTHKRPSTGRDASQSKQASYSIANDQYAEVIGANIPCDVQATTSTRVDQYGQKTIMTTHDVFFQKNPGAQEGDIYEVTRPGTNLVETLFVEAHEQALYNHRQTPWHSTCHKLE